jgi:hypothetical protein
MKKVLMTVLVLSLFAFVPAQAAEETKTNKEQATESAQKWLSLIDEEKYEESWQEAAAYFKNAVPEQAWELAMNNVRVPLGKLVSRELVSAEPHTSMPGAPDGHYVVIVFKTKFENKAEALETVTPMKEKDGVWRVSGYYIN